MSSFFSKLFSKGKDKVEAPPSMSMAEIDGWLSHRYEEMFKDVGNQSNQLYGEIVKVSNNILLSLEGLAEKEVSLGEESEGIANTIRVSKNSMVRGIRESLSELTYKEFHDFDEILDSVKSLSTALNRCKELTTTHGRILAHFYRSEARELRIDFAKLEVLFTRLSQLTEKYREKFVEIDNVKEQVRVYETSEDAIEAYSEKINRIKTEMNTRQYDLDSLHNTLARLRNSEEHQEIVKIENEVSELEAKIAGLKNRFEGEFRPLTRALRKYLYIRGLEKQDRELIHRYMDAPSKAILFDNNLQIMSVLSDLKKCLETQRIDDKDSEKLLSRIQNHTQAMPKTRNQIMKLQTDIRGKVKSLETPFHSEIEQTTRRIIIHEKEQKSYQIQLRELEEKLNREREGSSDMVKKINDTVIRLYGITVQ